MKGENRMRTKFLFGSALLAGAALAIAGCAEEANYITEFEDIPGGEGSICPAGGVRLLAGFDEDDDDKLSTAEIDRMDNVCNGEGLEGPEGLLRVEELPPGGRCRNGGAVVFSGVDDNNNRALDDDEITDATFVCNGTDFVPAFEACEGTGPEVVEGTIIVNTEAELAALAGVTCIRGNLVIDAYPGDDLESLSALEAVTNDFLLINSATVGSVAGLRNLKVVGGNFLLQNMRALTSLEGFDALENVMVRFSIAGLPISDLRGLETFTIVKGRIELIGNEMLTSVAGLENMTEVRDLVLDNNDALTDLSGLDNLEHVTNNLQLVRNDAITAVTFPSLQRVDGVFDVFESEGVTMVVVPNLLLPGSIRIRDNEVLTITEFPRVIVVAGIVEYLRNEALTTVRYPSLSYTSGSFYFGINTSLTEVTAPNLTTVGAQLYFRENPMITNFNGIANLRSIGTDLGILDMDGIDDMEGLGSLTTVNGSFYVEMNNILVTFDGMDSLRIVRNKFQVKNNPNLCEPEIMELQSRITIGGDTDVSGNCTGGGATP